MKTWTKPHATMELFEPNEYVAACWSVSCAIPAENGGSQGYDPFRPGDSGNLHRAAHCGAADGFVFTLDDNGTPIALTHVKSGSTGGSRSLACAIYTGSDFTVPRDITTIKPGETIYWTTVNGRTWHHHGVVQAGNHS